VRLAALLVVSILLCAAAGKPAKRGKESAAEPALIAVSVFREPGFAVAGAEVELSPETDGKSPAKTKKWKATADSRGEYVFRVAPSAMHYTVAASGKGLKPQQKSVAVEGEGRIDVTFMLEQESK
jgi:hypothetical protein